LNTKRAANQLLQRLADNESVLIEVYTLLTEAVGADRRVAPAGEWLLDNFYLIEEQIRMAKRYLPKSYSYALPRLLSGPAAGLPRVYDIARETMPLRIWPIVME
jgi:cyclic beta-1,2-glucan synthetase